jgi:hypothetical protein
MPPSNVLSQVLFVVLRHVDVLRHRTLASNEM